MYVMYRGLGVYLAVHDVWRMHSVVGYLIALSELRSGLSDGSAWHVCLPHYYK